MAGVILRKASLPIDVLFNWSRAISELLISSLFFHLILLSAIYRIAYYLCEIVYRGCEVAKLILFVAKFTMNVAKLTVDV
jgi:hypothetical protein